MKKHRFRLIASFLTLAAFTLMALYLTYDFHQRDAAMDLQDNVAAQLNIALVNEDMGAIYQDDEFNLGRGYVRRVEQSQDHNWYVVSRGVAERGLQQGSYQLMVVIPSGFSQALLGLDKRKPEHIEIEYQVNATGTQRVTQASNLMGEQIVAELNTLLVDMYVASILGNLYEAQTNVTEIVADYSQSVGEFDDNLNPEISQVQAAIPSVTQSAQSVSSTSDSLVSSLENQDSSLELTTQNFDDFGQQLAQLLDQRAQAEITFGEYMQAVAAFDQDLFDAQIDGVMNSIEQQMHELTHELQDIEDAENFHNKLDALDQAIEALNQDISQQIDDLDSAGQKDAESDYITTLRDEMGISGDGSPITLETFMEWGMGQSWGDLFDPDTDPANTAQILSDIRADIISATSDLPYLDPTEAALNDSLNLDYISGWDDEGIDVIGHLDQVRADLGDDMPQEPSAAGNALRLRFENAKTAMEQPPTDPGGHDAKTIAEYAAATGRVQERYAATATLSAVYGLVQNIADGAQQGQDVRDFDVTDLIEKTAEHSAGLQVAALTDALGDLADTQGNLQASSADLVAQMVDLGADSLDTADLINQQILSIQQWRNMVVDLDQDLSTFQVEDSATGQQISLLTSESGNMLGVSETLKISSESSLSTAQSIFETVSTFEATAQDALETTANLDEVASEVRESFEGTLTGSQQVAGIFAQSLSNAYPNGSLNEDLVSFISHPVQGSSQQLLRITDFDNLYIWLIMIYMLTAFGGHVLSQSQRKSVHDSNDDNAFMEQQSRGRRQLAGRLIAAAMLAVAVGGAVGYIGYYDLGLTREYVVQWAVLIVLVSLTSSFVHTWMFAHMRNATLGVILVLATHYLLMNQIALDEGSGRWLTKAIATLNPLVYAEELLVGYLRSPVTFGITAFILTSVAVAAALWNVLVRRDLLDAAGIGRKAVT